MISNFVKNLVNQYRKFTKAPYDIYRKKAVSQVEKIWQVKILIILYIFAKICL